MRRSDTKIPAFPSEYFQQLYLLHHLAAYKATPSLSGFEPTSPTDCCSPNSPLITLLHALLPNSTLSGEILDFEFNSSWLQLGGLQELKS